MANAKGASVRLAALNHHSCTGNTLVLSRSRKLRSGSGIEPEELAMLVMEQSGVDSSILVGKSH